MLAVNLSIRLDVLALVRFYHTNKLISHEPLLNRKATEVVPHFNVLERTPDTTSGISDRFQSLSPGLRQVIHVLLTLSPLDIDRSLCLVRLACLIHAVSIQSEPRSNSQKIKKLDNSIKN